MSGSSRHVEMAVVEFYALIVQVAIIMLRKCKCRKMNFPINTITLDGCLAAAENEIPCHEQNSKYRLYRVLMSPGELYA